MAARSILVVNSKGGCGKSTLSSNLASYYAREGARTAIFDYDRQMSCMRWLDRRPQGVPQIKGVTGWEYHPIAALDWIVMDPPAQIQRRDLIRLVTRADAIVIPVLPSPIDIAAAADFIRDLLVYAKVRTTGKPVAVVANRVRTNTVIFERLKKFLTTLNIPFVASIRDTQNYIHASANGLGIFELKPSVVSRDLEQWQPLLQWLRDNVERHAASLAGFEDAPLRLVETRH